MKKVAKNGDIWYMGPGGRKTHDVSNWGFVAWYEVLRREDERFDGLLKCVDMIPPAPDGGLDHRRVWRRNR